MRSGPYVATDGHDRVAWRITSRQSWRRVHRYDPNHRWLTLCGRDIPQPDSDLQSNRLPDVSPCITCDRVQEVNT